MIEFPTLFSPLRLGSVQLENRIVSSPHGLRLSRNSLPSDRDVEYYREKARGGSGLVIQEALRVHRTSLPPGSIAASEQTVVPGLRAIAEAVHAENRPMFGQIAHQGRQTQPGEERLPLWGPSPIPGFFNHQTPHVMTTAEIAEVVACHAATARNLVEAGYDGVEIHSAHGYLLQQFLSPLSNRRDDGYGGSLANRARFILEVIRAVRQAAPGLVLGIRFSGDEYVPGGLTIDDMVEAIVHVVESEAVDYVSITACNYESTSLATMVPDMYFETAAFVDNAGRVKAAIGDVPVIAVGRIVSPGIAETVLRHTNVDLVGVARGQIADPNFASKASTGRSEEIRPCLGVNVCWRAVINGSTITCAVNPRVGRETEWAPESELSTDDPQRIVVVGGGPAGIEAARVLAEAGHHIVLFERDAELGGQLQLAARAPGRARLSAFAEWGERELRRLGVELRLGTLASAEDVLAREPAAVVLATGSDVTLGDVQVGGNAHVIDARAVLSGADVPTGRVLVVDADWQWQAPSTAEFLAAAGGEVHVATSKQTLGVTMPPSSVTTMYERMDERGIAVHTLCHVLRISGRTVTVEHSYSHRRWEMEFDAVVVAGAGVASGTELQEALRDASSMVLTVGDCAAPRHLDDATFDGHRAAREIHAALTTHRLATSGTRQ